MEDDLQPERVEAQDSTSSSDENIQVEIKGLFQQAEIIKLKLQQAVKEENPMISEDTVNGRNSVQLDGEHNWREQLNDILEGKFSLGIESLSAQRELDQVIDRLDEETRKKALMIPRLNVDGHPAATVTLRCGTYSSDSLEELQAKLGTSSDQIYQISIQIPGVADTMSNQDGDETTGDRFYEYSFSNDGKFYKAVSFLSDDEDFDAEDVFHQEGGLTDLNYDDRSRIVMSLGFINAYMDYFLSLAPADLR